MSCLPCFNRDEDPVPQTAAGCGRDLPLTPQYNEPTLPPASTSTSTSTQEYVHLSASSGAKSAKTFSFRELAMATRNFRQECLVGEGGFGRVFKGELQSKGIVVAVKQLDRTGLQENIEFVEEVMNLTHLNHPNLVNLIGYCADGSQRLLVYEFVPMGSLNNRLFGEDRKPLDWNTRMKIACGIANGLEYLHEKANPPVIYRRLKPSNVLLDEDFAPKLSDYGLAKIGAGGRGGGDGTNQSSATTVMSTFGYSAPEQTRGEEITVRSDIYCFGIILLELITGRRVVDTTRPSDEQNLVTWAQPIFKDPKRFTEMADPRLNNAFPVSSLNQAVGIAAMCLQEEAVVRPMVGDIVSALTAIAMSPYNSSISSSEASFTPPAMQRMEFDSSTTSAAALYPNKGSSSVGSNSSFSDSNNGSSNYVSEKASVSQYDMETADDSSCESSYYQSQSYGGDNSEESSSSRTAQQEGDSLQESSYQSDDGESSSSSEDESSREEDGCSSVSTKGTSNINSVDTVSSSTSVPTTTTSSSSASSSSKRSKRSSRKSKKPKSKRSSRVVTFREPSMNSRYSTSKKYNEAAGMVSEPKEQQEERASSSSSSSDEEETGAKCNNSSEHDQRAPRKGSKTRPRKGSRSRKQRRGKNTDGASDRSRASGKPSKESLRLST